jgi:hypothetical protein
MAETILIFLSGSGVLGLIFYGSVWLLKKSTEKLLEKELERHKSELSKELELYKRELDLLYQHKLSLQNKRRELFEQFSDSLENMFRGDDSALSLELNKLYGLLTLYAPDSVYVSIKNTLEGKRVEAKDAKPIIYYALRKELFGTDTKLEVEDLHKHVSAQPVSR